jgi:hypothetical protein
MGRPGGGAVGTRINRPLDAGETARSPEHTHTVSVNDPGHTHAATVHDPGHDHTVADPGHGHAVTDPGHGHTLPKFIGLVSNTQGVESSSNMTQGVESSGKTSKVQAGISIQERQTGVQVNLGATDITVTSELSKSHIDVALDADEGGEGYPLAYVLVCERVAPVAPLESVLY